MDTAFIEAMRTKLLAEKEQVATQLASISKKDRVGRFPGDAEADFPDYGSSEEENTDEVITYQQNLSTSSDLESYLDDITAALAKIDAGAYGTCEKCKSPIAADRLKVFPAARRCMDCSKS